MGKISEQDWGDSDERRHSDKLAERDLPKTGNLDDLVNRLVEADLNK